MAKAKHCVGYNITMQLVHRHGQFAELLLNVGSELHALSVLTSHRILTSTKALEKERTDKIRHNRPDSH